MSLSTGPERASMPHLLNQNNSNMNDRKPFCVISVNNERPSDFLANRTKASTI